MIMARPCERRVRTLVVFVVVTYALSSCLYLFLDREPPSLLLLPNATWWRTNSPPYNMSLLEGSNDMKWLVDNPGFEFLINNKRCDGVDPVFLVVFVHSAPTNFHKRQVIRNTWGHEENLAHDPMRIVFLLGTVNETRVQQQIDEENALYHDVVQGNFVDSYRNLTYKHVMGLKWVTYYCRQARFVFKTDDDIFVDIFQLTTFLKDTFGQTGGVANLMMCYLIRSPHVKRSQRSKWRVSFKEYPARKYPTYCAGWGILMSPDVVFKLYLLSSKIPYFWVDDVHVTGTLASHVGISHVDFTEKLALTAIDVDKWLNGQNVIKPYLFGYPNSDSETILALWNRTMQYYHRPLVPSR
ncbi:Beta-1,3-galactosyltransferase 5 [Araneus ventricosus]|uniref:Hexosyltransferase n=1 Tax=Araneus ventricosus TaxID=182803 RepID=A0A4Y2EJ11_ARAVE|nr:Beta-1,3-galactosyltransferase 5 [Araneus ventricosus]